jgi:hypothetical protein
MPSAVCLAMFGCSSAILMAIAILRVMTSAPAQNAPATGSLPHGKSS